MKKFRKEFRSALRRWDGLKALGGAGRGRISYLIVSMWTYVRAQVRLKQMEQEGLFVSTNLETFGPCNRKCSFCFNHDRFEKRKQGAMKESVWNKMIDELGSINYAGRISPYFYGEPLLDKRLMKLVAYARRKCPLATIRVNTNGDYLDEAMVRKAIVAGVDKFVVTNYDDTDKPVLEQIAKKYRPWIKYRQSTNFRIQNRGGDLFDKSGDQIFEPCYRPSSQLVVNWQGEVALCCNDFYAEHSIGNVKDSNVLDIWRNEAFTAFRETLEKKGGRQQIEFCKGCDMDGAK